MILKILGISFFALCASLSTAYAGNPAILQIPDGGCGVGNTVLTATSCRTNLSAAQSGANTDITSLSTLNQLLSVVVPSGDSSAFSGTLPVSATAASSGLNISIPAGTGAHGTTITTGGFPAGQPGIFHANTITGTVNQPLSGNTTPGSSTSSTYETLRVQTPVGTGWVGVELRSIQAVVNVTGKLGTDANMQDLVSLSGSISSSFDNGIYTLYAQSNGVTCTSTCWTRSMVGYENDSTDNASILPSSIISTTYSASNPSYGNVPTLTFVLNTPLPSYLIANPIQYFTILTATTSWPLPTYAAPSNLTNRWQSLYISSDGLTLVLNGPTIPSNQTFGTISGVTIGDVTQRFGLNLNDNGTSHAGKESAIRISGGWWNGIMYDKSDADGPVKSQGVLIKGYNTFAASAFAEFTGDDFGNDLNFDGFSVTGVNWNKVIRYVTMPVINGTGGVNGTAVYSAGGGTCSIQPTLNVTWTSGVLTVNSVANGGTCTVFPPNLVPLTYVSGTASGWVGAEAFLNQVGPTLPSTNLTIGSTILYGHSVSAPTSNPLPANLRLPFSPSSPGNPGAYPTDLNPATPISYGADFDAPGVGSCPAGTQGQCQIVYQGTTKYDIPWYGPTSISPSSFCSSGTLLFGSGVGGSPIQVTTDGTGTPTSTNILNLSGNSQSEVVNLDMILYEQGNARAISWTNWEMMLIRGSGGAKTFAAGMASTVLDPSGLAISPSAQKDNTNSGITISVTPPSSLTTWTATACARVAHAQ